MRQYQVYASIVALLVVCGEAKAGDKEDVIAAVNSWYTLLAAGDIEALDITPHTRFSRNGGMLSIVNPAQVKAWLTNSGVKLNIQGHHGDAEIYGDAAVYTGYETVNITPPNGDGRQESNRLTVVFAKDEGDWRAVYVHVSSLTPVNPE